MPIDHKQELEVPQEFYLLELIHQLNSYKYLQIVLYFYHYYNLHLLNCRMKLNT